MDKFVNMVVGGEGAMGDAWMNIQQFQHTRAELGALHTRIEVLAGAVKNIDAAHLACPVEQSRRRLEVCPRCQATSSGNCSLNVRALLALEVAARAFLEPQGDKG